MKKLLAFAVLIAFAAPADAADTFGKTVVKTAGAADVQAQITGSDGSSLAQVAASNGAAAGNGLFVLGAVYNSSLPSNTSGRAVALQTDINGRLIVTQDASAGLLSMNLQKVLGATLAANNPVFTQLSDGAAVYVGAKTGQLPSALGQNTMANSLTVAIASNQSTLAVTSGAPSGSSFNNPAVTNIAAAGTSAIVCKSGLAVSQPTKPLQYVISAPGAVRCQLRYNDNSSMTNFASVVTTPGAPTVIWVPPSGIVGLTTSSTSTTQQYEANCTNFDAVAEDVSCAVVYCQSAAGC